MKKSDELFLGLMSGTSMDGIDAVIVRFNNRSCDVLAGICTAYPEPVRESLISLRRDPDICSIDAIGRLDSAIGECFAAAANKVLETAGIQQSDIIAIGSHGQTIRHQPDTASPFTLQIGDPNIIAARTGITVVADFRRRDIAEGGQGAPLATAFHHWLFADEHHDCAVLNIGGIANVTVLPARGGPVTGFDTGPGNTLLDAWIGKSRNRSFDENGTWADGGIVSQELLNVLLQDDYFAAIPPKSTGFEHFNLEWLAQNLASIKALPSDQNLQATLAELTCLTITDAIREYTGKVAEIFICGGGFHNRHLIGRLTDLLPDVKLRSTATKGVDPDWVEAAAFAWLARQRIEGRPGNLPSVTGASKPALLGGIFAASL